MRRVRLAVATSYAVLIGTGLLITLCGSANAATVHRSKPRHVQGLSFQYAVPPRPPFHYDDTRATTIRPSLAAARRCKNETTRSCSEFSSAFGGMATGSTRSRNTDPSSLASLLLSIGPTEPPTPT